MPRWLRVIPALTLILSLLAAPLAVSAANDPNAVTFTITPALIDQHVNPGQTITEKLTLFNRSDTAQPFRAYTKNFAAKNLDGEVTFGDDNITSFAASTWINLDQPNILLPPKSSIDVTATISVPKNAEPGGHYASVLFEQMVQDNGQQGSHVVVAARLAALIFLTVSGNIIEAGQVLGARPGDGCTGVVCGLKAPTFIDHGPVPFSFIFTNTGNVHVRPKGDITIYQGKTKVATLPITDRAVLPNSQRQFDVTWDRVVLAGMYTAKLHLVYGSKNYTIDMQKTFWAFPWQVVAIVAGIIILAGGIVISRKYFSVKRLHQKAKAKK